MRNNLWFQVEQEIANLLVERLENSQMNPERAVEIAKFVVRSIPKEMSDKQMLEIIPNLDDQFTELASIVHKHLLEDDQTKKTVGLENARKLLEQYLQKKI